MSGPDNSQNDETGAPQERGGSRFFGRRTTLQTPSEALHPDAAPPPPPRPKAKRRPVLSAMSGALSLLLIAALAGIGFVSFATARLSEPGPLQADRVVNIPAGTEVVRIVDMLEKAGVINQPTLFKSSLWIQRKWGRVKAGEYLFKAHASHNSVMDTLVRGRQLLHSVTIPEGLTSQQIVERLRENEVLAGDIKEIPPEGSLLPETYKVSRGTSRAALLRKMALDQKRLLDRIWEKRARDLPLKSKYELLTLASIIEKETGRADERTRVAAVFYNRLRKGMRLQSDPTIVYGLVGGQGTLGRPIQRDEIRKPTPYNTYVIPALPPGPIANPGRAAMEAAANPSRTDDIYFVADGTGGHAFARTLDEHNRNVRRWRQIEAERKSQQNGGTANGGTSNGPGNGNVDRVTPAPEEDDNNSRRKRGRRGASLPPGFFGALAPAFGGPADTKGKNSSKTNNKSNPELAKLAAALKRKGSKSAGAGVLALAPVQNFGAPASPAMRALGKALQPRAAGLVGKLSGPAHKPAASGVTAPATGGGVTVVAKNTPAAMPSGKDKAGTGAQPDKPTRFAFGPDVDKLGLKIIGVTPDVTDSPLDGPVTDDPPADPGPMQTHPMSAAKRADLARRAARYGASPAMAGNDAPAAGGTAAARPDAPVQTARVAPSAQSPKVRRIYDASEGTKLDPLKNKSWDLNSTQVIPDLKQSR